MTNANDPAMPVNPQVMIDAHSGGSWEHASLGLTKREMFAMHAPEMPDWFSIDYPDFVSPLSDEEKAHMREYSGDNYGYEHWEAGKQAYKKKSSAYRIYLNNHSIAKYFSWRTFYADNMLAELAKDKELNK